MSEGNGQKLVFPTPLCAVVRHRKKRAYLAAYAATGVKTFAARFANVDYSTSKRWYLKDAAFALASDECNDEATDALVVEARRRAFDGSDLLLIFLLKAHRPDVYRDRYDVRNVNVNINRDADDLRASMQDMMQDPECAELAERLANKLSQKAVAVKVLDSRPPSKPKPKPNGRNGNGRATAT
ncbi:hypothetical protein LCGC14_1308890 [marine sediment metagenome]|uniref:Terminase small subunit n=1 Tax=marine sediment metagenome TaxID=412755 RepID=A0A0F9N445_9ZZZZ